MGTRDLLAGLTGAIGFLILRSAAGAPYWAALVAALLLYGGLRWLLLRRLTRPAAWGPSVADPAADGTDPLAELRERIGTIRALAKGCARAEGREAAGALCGELDRYVRDLRQRPERTETARLYLNSLLESLGRLLEGYARVAPERAVLPETRPSLERAEAALRGLREDVRRRRADLLSESAAGLEAEVDYLTDLMGILADLDGPGGTAPPAPSSPPPGRSAAPPR